MLQVSLLLLPALSVLADPPRPTPVAQKTAEQKKTATPRPHARERPPLDFSGTWELDSKISRGVSPYMKNAALSVVQTGNRIWISPVDPRAQRILAEEIVADGRSYEKVLGPAGKGLVTAQWAADGQSLWIEITATSPDNPKAAVQRAVWKLSSDGKVWVRETISNEPGGTRQSRLVFRKRTPVKRRR